MYFHLPDDETLYSALLASDPAYDGRALVGVTSTGIFCRLTCPARKPKRQNCRFFKTATACLEAGFRPCRRCHPMAAGGAGPQVRRLLALLEEDPEKRWSEADLTAMNYEVSTLRRAFKRLFGMTFLELARQRRLGMGLKALAGGARVIDAQLQAGFSSPAAFREAFTRLMGVAPGRLDPDARIKADWIDTELGAMLALADKNTLHLLEFADRAALPRALKRLAARQGALGLGCTPPIAQLRRELESYFSGTSATFSVPLAQSGTSFQHMVWDALCRIPAGITASYSEVARIIGQPTASRAVARANGANQIAILVPCHRVIGADGSLTGYGGGLWRKERLLEMERHFGDKGE